ncbi:MAG: hypothetical protein LC700_03585 [Actinobacteria bacterium]|nr:hypothetical protein [Actinomycetota bacterium]
MTVARSVADVLDQHVVFEVESIDRMYLNVWVPRLAYGGGVAGFFVGHRGHHYASTALMDPMTKTFVADIHGFVAARGLELVHFAKGQRKDDLAQEFLAGFTEPEGVLFVGRAQEKAGVWRTQRRYNPVTGGSYAWLVRSSAFINFFYFSCVDGDFGPFFLKFSTYFPSTATLCINGNEWAKRQATKAGIGFEALEGGFAAVEEVNRLQQICDSFGPEHIEALLRKWLKIVPNPFTPEDETAGYRYELSILQGRVLSDPDARGPGVRADLLRAGPPATTSTSPRPDQIGLVFDRRIIAQGPPPDPGPVPHPGHHRGGHPEPARGLQERQDQTVPQGRQGTANRDHDQRHPRFRTVPTADRSEPDRAAADRLHRQPAPPARRAHQPRPDPRRPNIHRPHHADRHRHRHPHPRAAFRRHQSPRAAPRPTHPPAATPRIHQP